MVRRKGSAMSKRSVGRFLHFSRVVNRMEKRTQWLKLPDGDLYRGSSRIMALDKDHHIVPQGGGSSLSRSRAGGTWQILGTSL